MSILEDPRTHRRQFTVALIMTLAFGLAFQGTSGGAPVPSNICTPSNELCQQIQFDQAVYGNSSNAQAVLTSTSWIATLNETLVVIADSNIGGVITSITDTASDTFIRRLFLSQNCVPCQNFEIWTTKYAGATGIISTVTVTWNATTNNVFVMSSYLNVLKTGNATGANFPSGNSGSVNIMPIFSGSKIVGGIGISPPSGASCNSAVAGTFLTQRKDSCSLSTGIPEVEVASADNMTVLRNTQSFTFAYSTNNVLTPAVQIGALELLGFDQEPAFPNFNNFCTTTNGFCVTTQYAINAVKQTTSANALNKALALGTAYCTGITTSAITIGSSLLVGWAEYGGVALNTTGAKLQVQFYVSTNAPSTTFGSGLCATGGTVIGVGYIYFAISGALSATNAFTVSINGNCPTGNGATCTSGTYYGWIEITAQNFVIGSLGFDQVTNQAYSLSSINLMEIK